MLIGIGDGAGAGASTSSGCGATNQCSSVWANCRATNIQWDANCNVANQPGIIYAYDATCTRGTQPGHCSPAIPVTVGQASPTPAPSSTSTTVPGASTSTSADLIAGIPNTYLMIGGGALLLLLLLGKK